MRHQPEIGIARWTSAALALLLLAGPPPVRAEGSLQLSVSAGRVTLVAKGVSAAQILAEWARRGGVTVEGTPGSEPIWVELVDVPEKEALAVLLRSAPGYVAVARKAPAADASHFERVVIMSASRSNAPAVLPPATTPPATAPEPAVPQFPTPTMLPTGTVGVHRLLDQNGVPIPDDQDGAPPPGVVAAPPGFSAGDPPPQPAPPVRRPATAETPQPAVVGVPVPGMIVPAPTPARSPQR